MTRKCIMRCNSLGDLLLTIVNHPVSSDSTFAAISPSLWHSRLGDPRRDILNTLNKHKSISCKTFSSLSDYQSCSFGKHVKLPFSSSTSTMFSPFDVMHSDIWNSPILSTNGHKYYILFLDDFTNFLWTFPLGHKQRIRQHQIQTILSNHWSHFSFLCPYTSSQNGKAECKIRAINNIIRTLLAHSSMPPSFWHHAKSEL
ncbi:hypothetical protein OSB04_un001787 [Centaurea solstitialis]|uniref:GAG-pre-integrase domain-containing protein n=1 Tax=Centaurea solstitialis TaxID=347529 RepID=A0AA38S3R8_9ASTR|nr:hypothetical protein OSB04_un001787 [Centaurea solstitialis]